MKYFRERTREREGKKGPPVTLRQVVSSKSCHLVFLKNALQLVRESRSYDINTLVHGYQLQSYLRPVAEQTRSEPLPACRGSTWFCRLHLMEQGCCLMRLHRTTREDCLFTSWHTSILFVVNEFCQEWTLVGNDLIGQDEAGLNYVRHVEPQCFYF